MPDMEILRRMTGSIRHRGPDAEGYHVETGVGIGHRRLSIIDIEGGGQPLYNEDGSVCVAYNGEIYNHLILRKELEDSGHVFRTRADTEVLVHLYEEYGDAMVTRLSGMFAFAIWDVINRKLLLGRDRMGQKPLFFAETRYGLVFGSEMKSVLASGLVDRCVDPDGLSDFLSLNYVVAPRTIVSGIKQLPPGQILTLENGTRAVRSYWDFDSPAVPVHSQEESAEELYRLLGDAVDQRLMSEVPLGVLLSGGMDSSSVVAMMAQRSSQRIKTFSIGFEEASYDESRYARLIANRYNTEHHELVVNPDIGDILPGLVWSLDEPFGDASAIPAYLLAGFARSEITVALNGDGADELFGGYPTLQADRIAASYRLLPSGMRKTLADWVNKMPVSFSKVSIDLMARQFVAGASHDQAEWHYWWRLISTDEDKNLLICGDVANARNGPSAQEQFVEAYHSAPYTGGADRQMYVDQKTFLPGDILTKADRTTMGRSLEARSPFLDERVVDFANGLPFDFKVRWHEGKYILRQAMEGRIPDQTLSRRKRGFNAPISLWFQGPMRELLCDTLHESRIRQTGLFNPGVVGRIIDDHLGGRRDNGLRLWGLLSFQLWHERFIQSDLETLGTGER
ncbi:MAG: asparagine synthase (glutamine-hydrolyzing) [Candidatus Latescibacteria bacterium]|nr:asparagine synthase (glutamine-hydrolyzing) [Candidatus Latescibacterota bacterium]